MNALLIAAYLLLVFVVSAIANPQISESRSGIYTPDLEKFKSEKPRKVEKKKNKKADAVTSISPASRTNIAETEFWLRLQIRDANLKFVGNISQAEIRVLVDGVSREIDGISPSPNDSEIVFVLDMSPSSAIQEREIRSFVQEAVERLPKTHPISIWKFDSEYKVLLDRSLERRDVEKSLGKITYRTGTSLYDTVRQLCITKASLSKPRTIVLLSDGVDTTSQKSNAITSLNYSNQCNDAYYPVYLDTYTAMTAASAANPPRIIARIPGVGPVWSGPQIDGEQEKGREYLNALLSMTGGAGSIFPQRSSDISSSATQLAQKLTEHYFIKLKGAKPLVKSKVQVVVNKPNLMLYTQSVIE